VTRYRQWHDAYAAAVRASLQMFPAHAFGFCADGQPRHPLYLPHATALVAA